MSAKGSQLGQVNVSSELVCSNEHGLVSLIWIQALSTNSNASAMLNRTCPSISKLFVGLTISLCVSECLLKSDKIMRGSSSLFINASAKMRPVTWYGYILKSNSHMSWVIIAHKSPMDCSKHFHCTALNCKFLG